MAFLSNLNISASALTAQRLRMDVIAENIANATTTRTAAGTPYRRKFTVMQEQPVSFSEQFAASKIKMNGGGVKVSGIEEDPSAFKLVYDPQHPDANADGYVSMPNVDTAREMVDFISASRTYEANITMLNATKSMAMKALELFR